MREWRVSQWARANPFLVDVLLACLVTAVALLVHFHQHQADGRVFRDPAWWTVLVVVGACAPLAWRRVWPIPAALVVVVVQGMCEIHYINGPSWIPVLITVYGLGAYTSGRRRVLAVSAEVLIVAALVVAGVMDDAIEVAEAIGAFASLTVPLVVGDNVRRRRNELAELSARAERAERERELLALRRVGEERTRIARDLHDVVAHSVSAMVIQATAARRNVERAPDDAVALLTNIEDTGRRTMSELRQMLGVLRDDGDGASAAPMPTIGDLEVLVDSAADLDVTLSTSGAIETLPSGVALSAFRVVQEALTNVRRHAGPNVTIDVRVERTEDRLDVSVEDNGRGASTGQQLGYGLVGMGERVAAFGGTLRSGPRRAGGWQVRASFPLQAS
jgi:signal transduction histidine kinase